MNPLPKITADWLLSRVREVKRCGCVCMVWTGYSPHDKPTTNLGVRSNDKPVMVRRLVWNSAGRRFKTGWDIATTCNTPNCVELAHLIQVPHGGAHRLAGRTLEPTHVANITAALREASRFSDAEIARVRQAEITDAEAARELGCTREYVGQLRRGLWRMPELGPFSGLGAR